MKRKWHLANGIVIQFKYMPIDLFGVYVEITASADCLDETTPLWKYGRMQATCT